MCLIIIVIITTVHCMTYSLTFIFIRLDIYVSVVLLF